MASRWKGVRLPRASPELPRTEVFSDFPGSSLSVDLTSNPEVPRKFPKLPKGPFRTKNTTTIAKIVNYYAAVFLLRPQNLVRRGPFFEGKNVCNSQEKFGVHTRRAAIVNHPAVLEILRVVNLLRVVFLVRRGPLGSPEVPQTSPEVSPFLWEA